MTIDYQKLAKKATAGAVLGILFLEATAVLAKAPSDPQFSSQASLWQQINAPAAWDVTTGSRDVTVAIIDTGVDTWHDDLRDNIWINPYEIDGNAVDDDRNGYKDDIHGWNFVENNNDVRTSVLEHADDPEAVTHGTVIAGLIGAVGENSQSGVGLNWHVKLMPLRAIESTGEGDYDAVIQAVDYAVRNGADIISMSFVGDINDSALRDRLKAAYDNGVLVVAAAGNHTRSALGNLDDKPLYPACYDLGDSVNWMLTVGSVNALDQLSAFSNYGNCVDLVAPGENILSTERYAPQYGYASSFGGRPWRGTSFAAPLVAGAAALLKSLHSEWGPDKLIETLKNTADPVDGVNLAYQGKLGRGRLNVGNAVGVAAALKVSGRASGYYYFFSNSTINRLNFDTGQVEKVTTLPGEKIRSLAVYNPNFGSKAQLAVLLERRSFFYLKLLKDSGEAINEFSLELPVRKDVVVKRLKTSALQSAPGRFIVEAYYPSKKQTVFKAFDERGEVAREIALAGAVENWTLERYDGGLVAVLKAGKLLQARRLSWSSKPGAPVTLGKSDGTVEAVRSGRVTAGAAEGPVIIVRRGNRIEQTLVNFTNATTTTRLITETRDKAPWRLLLADLTSSEQALLFPFSTSGGIFRLAHIDGTPMSEIKLPELRGTTD